MDPLQEHMIENIGKNNGISRVFRVEVVFSLGYSKTGENHGRNFKT